jgi:hypothetical protein
MGTRLRGGIDWFASAIVRNARRNKSKNGNGVKLLYRDRKRVETWISRKRDNPMAIAYREPRNVRTSKRRCLFHAEAFPNRAAHSQRTTSASAGIFARAGCFNGAACFCVRQDPNFARCPSGCLTVRLSGANRAGLSRFHSAAKECKQ